MRVSKRTIVVGAIATFVLGVYPVIAQRDSYPHSHLPMFSVRRTETARIDTAIGISTHAEIVRLSPRLIADTDEVIMAKDAVVNAINSRKTDELCIEIANRVGKRKSNISVIKIVTETYNAVEWFRNNKTPTSINVYAECDVP